MCFVWLAAIVLFCIIEVATYNLITIWFAAGAVLAMIASFIFGPAVQVWVFVLSSILFLILTKPIVDKKLKPKKQATNADMLIGKAGLVIDDITPDKFAGKVRVSGQIWSAVSESGNLIDKGSHVRIKDINGVKLIVEEICE